MGRGGLNHLPGMFKALDSMPNAAKTNKQKELVRFITCLLAETMFEGLQRDATGRNSCCCDFRNKLSTCPNASDMSFDQWIYIMSSIESIS